MRRRIFWTVTLLALGLTALSGCRWDSDPSDTHVNTDMPDAR
jgi:hypothetical protein